MICKQFFIELNIYEYLFIPNVCPRTFPVVPVYGTCTF